MMEKVARGSISCSSSSKSNYQVAEMLFPSIAGQRMKYRNLGKVLGNEQRLAGISIQLTVQIGNVSSMPTKQSVQRKSYLTPRIEKQQKYYKMRYLLGPPALAACC